MSVRIPTPEPEDQQLGDEALRVAAYIRGELARRQLRAAHVRGQVGMSKSTLSRSLRGERAFDVEEVAAFAHLFGTDLFTLMDRCATSVCFLVPDLENEQLMLSLGEFTAPQLAQSAA